MSTSRLTVMSLAGVLTAASQAVVRPPDFNNDGFDDLAIGAPGERLGTVDDAGAVHVLYGTAARLSATGAQFWHQNTGGVADISEGEDFFGASLAWGDFNADGFSDLAIGVPFEDIGSAEDAGAVQVVYGRADGLTANRSQFWHQNIKDVADACSDGDHFGHALAVGDFNGDGRDDLAIGVPGENEGSGIDAGGVAIIYGGADGLRVASNRLFTQDTSGMRNDSKSGDEFGWALAVGDFNNDGRDDLAVGVPGESFSEGVSIDFETGGVHILYGSGGGLNATNNVLWHQSADGILDSNDTGDRFGHALAAGDFDGDDFDDLAIGIPGEALGGEDGAGAMSVMYGGSAGLAAAGNQFWSQDSAGVADASDGNESFGVALISGEFNGDGRDDLAVSVTGEGVGGDSRAGAVHVLFGGPSGIRATNSKFLNQDTSGILEGAENDDRFGSWLAVGDYDGSGDDDVAIGVPLENHSGVANAGAVQVLYSYNTGPSASNDQLWTQATAGIADAPEDNDRFGTGRP